MATRRAASPASRKASLGTPGAYPKAPHSKPKPSSSTMGEAVGKQQRAAGTNKNLQRAAANEREQTFGQDRPAIREGRRNINAAQAKANADKAIAAKRRKK